MTGPPRRTRVVLFEWMVGGHFTLYVRRFAEALVGWADVSVAAPDATCEQLADLPVGFVPLGAPRPDLDGTPQAREVVELEIDLMEHAIAEAHADHLIHLYSDRMLRRLIARPPLRARITVCVFRPRIHYPLSYRTPLPPRELAKAAFLEFVVARFRRRPDAHAVMTLDAGAVGRWSRRSGAPAFWLPEPPVPADAARPPTADWDCALYGALAERKGVHLLARALASAPTHARVVLAGSVDDGFAGPLNASVEQMVASGARVELRAWAHEEAAGLDVLARSRCAVLPYRGHYGMSRVLLEAAQVGTPVVAHRHGLIAHLVAREGLGRVVDCSDPRAFRAAVDAEVAMAGGRARVEALATFAARFSAARFSAALEGALRLERSPRTVAPRSPNGRGDAPLRLL